MFGPRKTCILRNFMVYSLTEAPQARKDPDRKAGKTSPLTGARSPACGNRSRSQSIREDRPAFWAGQRSSRKGEWVSREPPPLELPEKLARLLPLSLVDARRDPDAVSIRTHAEGPRFSANDSCSGTSANLVPWCWRREGERIPRASLVSVVTSRPPSGQRRADTLWRTGRSSC